MKRGAGDELHLLTTACWVSGLGARPPGHILPADVPHVIWVCVIRSVVIVTFRCAVLLLQPGCLQETKGEPVSWEDETLLGASPSHYLLGYTAFTPQTSFGTGANPLLKI